MIDTLTPELRGGWLGVPKAFSPFDFFGAALGAWLIYMGARDRANWQGVASMALGGTMIYIHTQRFFYAPQDAAGLVRLSNALHLTREDLAKVAAQLPNNIANLPEPPA